MTDNRNRTAPEIRKIFDVHGGSLGGTGCVAYLFDRKGMIVLASQQAGAMKEEQIMEIALENDALDVQVVDDHIEVYTAPEGLTQVTGAYEAAGIAIEMSQVSRFPQLTVDVEDGDTVKTVLKLLETLEDHDDVQSVSTNLNFQHPSVAQVLQNA